MLYRYRIEQAKNNWQKRHKGACPVNYWYLTGRYYNGLTEVYGTLTLLLPGCQLNPLKRIGAAVNIVMGVIYQPGGNG